MKPFSEVLAQLSGNERERLRALRTGELDPKNNPAHRAELSRRLAESTPLPENVYVNPPDPGLHTQIVVTRGPIRGVIENLNDNHPKARFGIAGGVTAPGAYSVNCQDLRSLLLVVNELDHCYHACKPRPPTETE